jgi:uncharacterized protein (TIGR02996 family)
MTHEEAFLADILAHPDDDAPRLILSDWLDENGQPERAEFIRVQCRLAAGVADHEQRLDLKARQRELLLRHGPDWLGPFRGAFASTDFVRGFVERVSAALHTIGPRIAELCRWTPLRELRVEAWDWQGLADLAGWRCLERLRSLHLGSWINRGEANAAVRALGESPYLTGLRELDLGEVLLPPAAVTELAGSPLLGRLETLALRENIHSQSVAEALAESPRTAALRSLTLRGLRLGTGGLRALCYSSHFNGLTHLHLTGGSLEDAGLRMLAASPLLERLAALGLGFDGTLRPVSAAGLRALTTAPGIRALTVLNLAGCRVPAEALGPLAGSPFLLRLATLELNNNPNLGNDGAEALAGSATLPALRRLGLGGTRLGREGMKALARAPLLSQLEDLNLSLNGLEDRDLRPLAFYTGTPNLRRLNLSQNSLTAEGFRTLAGSPLLARLTHLDLGHNRIGPEGARALAESPYLTRLRSLQLNWSHPETQGIAALALSPVLSRLTALNLKGNHLTDAAVLLLAESPYLSRLNLLELQGNMLSHRTRQVLTQRFGPGVCQFG